MSYVIWDLELPSEPATSGRLIRLTRLTTWSCKATRSSVAKLSVTTTARDARFIGTTKNKLAREGAPKSPRCEVVFDGTHGRYRSINEARAGEAEE